VGKGSAKNLEKALWNLGYLSIDAIFEPIWSRSGLRVLTFIVPPGLMYIIWLIPSGMYW